MTGVDLAPNPYIVLGVQNKASQDDIQWPIGGSRKSCTLI
jgi:hypothetical protein